MDHKKKKTARSKNARKTQAEWSAASIPACLIVDILSRLPIKSIIICKSVCRTWFSLISEPVFIKLQQARSRTCVLFQTTSESKKLQLAQVERKATGQGFQVDKMRFPRTSLPSSSFRLINSCNGFICIADGSEGEFYGENVYISNPVLSEWITIPVTSQSTETKCFAFGFDAANNQYKVLRTYYEEQDGNHIDVAEIYTLGLGQWRGIGKNPFKFGYQYFNTFVNGSIHWIHSDSYSGSDPEYIGCFDFESEQFSPLPLPPIEEDLDDTSMGVLKGCLCLCFFPRQNPKELELWVMKEYGIGESWTKQLVIRNLRPTTRYHEPLFSLSEEQLLMFHNFERVVCYDTKKERFRDTKVLSWSAKEENHIRASAYEPCFVSVEDVVKGEQLKVSRRRNGRSKLDKSFAEDRTYI